MSVRTALILTFLASALLGTGTIAVFGARGIRAHVVEEAQHRVDHDLDVLLAEHERRLTTFAEAFERGAEGIDPDDANLSTELATLRARLDLSLVNVCDVEGRRLGEASNVLEPAPLADDPVLRRALGGTRAEGTVRLDANRMRAEGGDALLAATALPTAGDAPHDGALFWWVAVPRRDASGRVVGLIYGGRALDRDLELVDDLRRLVFGVDQYAGKPLGTVTLFRGPVRVATNVVDEEGNRALGTTVSAEVAREVLEKGRTWSARAQVLNTWYLSAYAPLRDPDDATVGMLYVGLLEAPYRDLQAERLRTFLGMVAVVGLLAVLSVIWLVRRITRPLDRLNTAIDAFANDDAEHVVDLPRTYKEIEHLATTFDAMRDSIVRRDLQLKARNEELRRANRNYMEMLGFVTHELKAPLAAIQMQSKLVVDQHGDAVPEKARHFLDRIRRNSEELQGMVKDYLDLSRAERGELEAEPTDIDLRADVIDPAAQQAQPLLKSRSVSLEVDAPDQLAMHADAELLRILLTNLLTNAAKYGATGGRARVEARRDGDRVTLAVWNEGDGFSAEEHERLFAKFARLRNDNTKNKRGSGLGLYLCAQIAAQHGGAMTATSEPGQWARFALELPAGV